MRLIMTLMALACVAQVKLVDDPPLVTPPKAGKITGTISPAANIVEVYAITRNEGNTYKAASFDAKTGAFAFNDLAGDTVYDMGVKLKDGRIVEGIDLAFTGARLLRLAELRRKQLNLPASEAPHEFSQEDAKEIIKYTADLRKTDFFDLGRVLYIQGHGNLATMLVELIRDPNREFYDQQAGQIIWRVELWYFKWQHGGWERVANQERVLRRERIPQKEWEKISMEWLPAWSVYLDANGKCAPVKLQIPAKPDPSTGRLAKTAPDLQTDSNLLGITASSSPALLAPDDDDDL